MWVSATVSSPSIYASHSDYVRTFKRPNIVNILLTVDGGKKSNYLELTGNRINGKQFVAWNLDLKKNKNDLEKSSNIYARLPRLRFCAD